MDDWQLQDAKARFSEVVRRAREVGPQTVTVRGERAAVVVSAEEYDRLVQPPRTLLEILGSAPDVPDEIWDVIDSRDRSPPRDYEW